MDILTVYHDQGQINVDILTVYQEQGQRNVEDISAVNPVQDTRKGGYSNSVP